MSLASKKVVEFCRDNKICVRCKCRFASQNKSICSKCMRYILTLSKSSIAKFLLLQHKV